MIPKTTVKLGTATANAPKSGLYQTVLVNIKTANSSLKDSFTFLIFIKFRVLHCDAKLFMTKSSWARVATLHLWDIQFPLVKF